MKRSVLTVGLLLVAFMIGAEIPAVYSQTYPNKNIQFIIPNVPGSIMDINSRALVDNVEKTIGTQIIPVNKPGAATMIGTEALAKSKKDGYTIGYASNSIVYTRIINPQTVHFDPEKDIEPIGLHLLVPLAIAVQANSPWKTFADLIEYGKKEPGKARVDTIGIGSPAHFNLELIQSLTGARFTHIPFKGGESVITALLGGHIEVTYDAINKLVPHVESGKLRILLLTTKMTAFPNIPTLADLGHKQDLVSTWFAVYGPSGLPEDVKKVLIPAFEKGIRDPELKARIEKMHFVVDYRPPAQMKKMVTEEYERAVAIAEKVGLRKTN